MILLHFLLYAQKKRSKRKRHHGRKPISTQNARPLPAEKCLNQFEYAEFSAKTTFLKAGQPTWPQCVHADRACLHLAVSAKAGKTHRTEFGILLKSLLLKKLFELVTSST